MYPAERATMLAQYLGLPNNDHPDRRKAVARFARKWGGAVRGIYRHYKGGVYVVGGLTVSENDLEIMVSHMGMNGTHWVRPLVNFFEPLGGNQMRFKRLKFRPTDRGMNDGAE